MKRTELKDAFKRFQRLPILLPKGDARQPAPGNANWQSPRLDIARMPVAASTLRCLAE
jgi:hypothetical protein